MRGWRAGKGRGSRRAPGGRRPGGNLRPHLGEACLELIGRAVVALLGSLLRHKAVVPHEAAASAAPRPLRGMPLYRWCVSGSRTEGLRPFASANRDSARRASKLRSGLYGAIHPLSSRSGPSLGMRVFIAPVWRLRHFPAELARALGLPSDASVVETVDVILAGADGAEAPVAVGGGIPRERVRPRRSLVRRPQQPAAGSATPHPNSASESTNRTKSACREMDCFS